MPLRLKRSLVEFQLAPLGDPYLLAHEIHAVAHLRDGVLDLDARVHLEEVELPARVEQELDGAGAAIVHGARRFDRGRPHARAQVRVDRRRRRFFQELLVTPLDAALALAEMKVIPVRVAQHLDFDVTRLDEELLDIHGAVAEGTLRFGRRAFVRGGQLVGRVHDTNAFAAAAADRLERDRVSDRVGETLRGFEVRLRSVAARNDRNTGGLHRDARLDLVARLRDRLGRRTDEAHPGVLDGAREVRVLAQEPVTRMHGVAARGLRRVHDHVDAQVGLARRGRPDAIGLVGRANVEFLAVGVREHGNRPDPHFAQRPNDADGDFAAIGDADFSNRHGGTVANRTPFVTESRRLAYPWRMVNRDPNPHRDYRWGTLTLADLDGDPIGQLRKWFHECDPHMVIRGSVTLATVDADGAPDARVVLCRGIEDDGLVFFTNYDSAKGRQLAGNSAATLLFFWAEFERQIRVYGTVAKTSEQQSDEYFARRPRGSQIAAAASPQSDEIAGRDELETRVADLTARLDGAPVPRPENWGGYKLTPHTFEFWQGRESRLHDRLRYRRRDDGAWTIDRLAP